MRKYERWARVLGSFVGVVSMGLAAMWFGWKLALVLFLALLGNNLEQKFKP